MSQLSQSQNFQETKPILDVLSVEIEKLFVPYSGGSRYNLRVELWDRLILNTTVRASDRNYESFEIVNGCMEIDPTDITSLTLLVNKPLTVCLQEEISLTSFGDHFVSDLKPNAHCCNVDMTPLLIGEEIVSIEKRLEPLEKPTLLNQKTWCNLPLIKLELRMIRNEEYRQYHEALSACNLFSIAVLGVYNTKKEFDYSTAYVVATRMPCNDTESDDQQTFSPIAYVNGRKINEETEKFLEWEMQRQCLNTFSKSDERIKLDIDDVVKQEDLDVEDLMDNLNNSVQWMSFHQRLLTEETLKTIPNLLLQYSWPIEVKEMDEVSLNRMMAFLDLSQLLYPGTTSLTLAVPLDWFDEEQFTSACGCTSNMAAIDEATATANKQNTNKRTPNLPEKKQMSQVTCGIAEEMTGLDDQPAIIIVQVKLARPLVPVKHPSFATPEEIQALVKDEEQIPPDPQRKCMGRGCFHDFANTVKFADKALVKVPGYGLLEMGQFQRQLKRTKTYVEVSTGLTDAAALYINDRFHVNDYIDSEDQYKEMMMMAHSCLLNETRAVLYGPKAATLSAKLRAARHAKHLQDYPHAKDLYLEHLVDNISNGNIWRELGYCMIEQDHDMAAACLRQSLHLLPRHPITLLCLSYLTFIDDQDSAECYFDAIYYFYPNWVVGLVTTQCYYYKQELFELADFFERRVKRVLRESSATVYAWNRRWESEFGDWWDCPSIPVKIYYLYSADILLRLRLVELAEVCLAFHLQAAGESPTYWLLVAMCCRLSGDVDAALCHVRAAIDKYCVGQTKSREEKEQIASLYSLEGECLSALGHAKAGAEAASNAASSAGFHAGPANLLRAVPRLAAAAQLDQLKKLCNRMPSAYAYYALAKSSLETQDKRQAVDCLQAALKIDPRFAPAWEMLSRLVHPVKRRLFYKSMALNVGAKWVNPGQESCSSECYGTPATYVLKECACLRNWCFCQPVAIEDT